MSKLKQSQRAKKRRQSVATSTKNKATKKATPQLAIDAVNSTLQMAATMHQRVMGLMITHKDTIALLFETEEGLNQYLKDTVKDLNDSLVELRKSREACMDLIRAGKRNPIKYTSYVDGCSEKIDYLSDLEESLVALELKIDSKNKELANE